MAATTYLTDTQGTPTNNLKWTWSSWIKRGELAAAGHAAVENIFTTYVDASNLFYIRFNDTDYIDIRNMASVGTGGRLITNAIYRDPSAWYHVVVVYDSANASAGDRMRLYVNGVEETSFSLDTNPSSSQVCTMNADTRVVELGRRSDGSSNFTGVLAHTHFCDGQAYAASDFGETDATSGIWIAKSSPSVTYGNNGFFLKYQDTAAFGDDSSGNTNDFALSGTMTQTKDTPDNNFCTMNPLNNYLFNGTYSNGNNTVATDVKCWNSTTLGMTTGKWYWETKIVSSTSGSDWTVGFAGKTATGASDDGGSTNGTDVFHFRATGAVWNNGSTSLTTTSYTSGDIISIALDLTNNKWYVGKNGTWLNSGDPTSGATGTGAVGTTTASGSTTAGAYFPSVSYLDAAQSGTFSTNFGNGYFGTTIVSSSESDDAGIGSFEYDVPAGYYALCTNNLGDQS